MMADYRVDHSCELPHRSKCDLGLFRTAIAEGWIKSETSE
jgi:hypothetical protein